ncbi:MAG: phosphoribosylamine--glycine ligase [Gammaproteobacteria bacterium]|nr:MAG: phosphoribosylamine--glycine ligase [Gammaproteobacteria bacterium]
MNVLIIGAGGREHALAWKVAQSPKVERVLVAPGNAGTALEAKCHNTAISADDIEALTDLVANQSIDLTIVGPEAPLVDGIVDTFQAKGLAIFGPSKAAAQLEGSKAFAKDFMQRHHIPTAAYGVFTDIDAAVRFVEDQAAPIVVKADGLAAGKGVIIAQNKEQAIEAIHNMLADNAFGAAGNRVVIEEFLTGEEASYICMVDGEHILPMATSQDHKARDEGDRGPNTGGMGAYSPTPVITAELELRIQQEIIEPVVQGMISDGSPYRGFLYAGLMISPAGDLNVLEFNCRFGDPETQPIMMRLNSDLVDLIQAALGGTLNRVTATWDTRAAVGVVLAAGGYPGSYDSGQIITGIPECESADSKVFHAGTKLIDGQITTSGGRVLCVVGLGETVSSAQHKAYEIAKGIQWADVFFRRDIGYRAIEREQA